MTKYRAIVSIYFDDEDLEELADELGIEPERLSRDLHSTINGDLDQLSLSSNTWIEQIFVDGDPQVAHFGETMTVIVTDHGE